MSLVGDYGSSDEEEVGGVESEAVTNSGSHESHELQPPVRPERPERPVGPQRPAPQADLDTEPAQQQQEVDPRVERLVLHTLAQPAVQPDRLAVDETAPIDEPDAASEARIAQLLELKHSSEPAHIRDLNTKLASMPAYNRPQFVNDHARRVLGSDFDQYSSLTRGYELPETAYIDRLRGMQPCRAQ